MLRQVSPHPGAPGALSTSPDGALRVWYGPAMGAAFSGHSFTPPWLKRFLSSLWFPSQRRCPAAGWERPGEEASCLPGAAVLEEGELRPATRGGRRETHRGAAAHRACQFWHRQPPPSLSRFDPGRPAHACTERVSWVTPRRLSPRPANGYSRGHPRSSSLQHRSRTAQCAREQLLEPLRHAPLGGICREAGELNGVIHSSACRPPSSPHPNAPTRGQQGGAHASGSPATGSGVAQGTAAGHAGSSCPARQDGRAKARGRYFGKQRKLNHNTHTNSGANLQSRNASPCQELGYFPPSPRLAALS